MKAADILVAVKHSNPGAALVPELVIYDPAVVAANAAYHREIWPRYGRDVPPLTLDQWDIVYNGEPYQRRIDALMIRAGQRTAIEVKISRADFRRETPEKRRAWHAVCHRFVYAVPEGLIQPDEVPDGCGLWWITGLHARVVKKAQVTKSPDPLPEQITTALMHRVSRTTWPINRGAA